MDAGIVATQGNEGVEVEGVIAATVIALGLLSLIFSAVALNPAARAEKENLALLGRAERPPRRNGAHWVIAILIGWWVSGAVGALLAWVGAAGLAAPIGFAAWFLAAWGSKRALDSRRAE